MPSIGGKMELGCYDLCWLPNLCRDLHKWALRAHSDFWWIYPLLSGGLIRRFEEGS